MKKFLLSALAVVAMAGCGKAVVEPSPTASEAYGYISLDLSTYTEMDVVTKGIPSDGELDLFNVTLKGNNVEWTKKYSEIAADPDLLKLTVGTYTIEVENVTDAEAEEGVGCMRLYGVADKVEVRAGVTTPVTIDCLPANSRVTVAFDDTFSRVFMDPQVNITGGNRSFPMTWGHDKDNGVYWPGLTDLSWVLTAALSGDSSVSKRYDNTERPLKTVPGMWTQLTFTTSAEEGKIGVVITIVDDFSDLEEVTEPIDPFEGE